MSNKMTTEEHILANPVLRKITDELKQRPQAERTLAVADMQTAKGVAKYPETVNPSSKNIVEWLQHRFEEDFDGLVYTACALEVVEDMQHRFNEMQTALKLILDDTITVADYEETIQNVRYIAKQGLENA